MADIRVIEGDFTECSGRYALVVGRFNGFVVESLVEGALDTLRRHGISDADVTIVRVPGAYEMPLAVKRVAETNDYDAIIALGAVIRGGTPHFEYVAGEASSGLGATGDCRSCLQMPARMRACVRACCNICMAKR